MDAENSKETTRQSVRSTGIVMCLRTITAFTLRLFLRTPCVIFAHASWGVGNLFEDIGDGFNEAQKKLKPITSAPFVFDWERQIQDMDEAQKLRTLKALQRELDT